MTELTLKTIIIAVACLASVAAAHAFHAYVITPHVAHILEQEQ